MQRSSSPSGKARTEFSIQRRSSEMPGVEVMCGAVLSRLHVFGEEECPQLKDHDRPPETIYAEGLGWVAAVRVEVMNQRSTARGSACRTVCCVVSNQLTF
jgi:hypothetical protein